MKRVFFAPLLGLFALLVACGDASAPEPPNPLVQASMADPQALVPPGSPCPAGAPCRILPLGDSLTDGYTTPGGYRYVLWQTLVTDAGRGIDLVGLRANGDASRLGDREHAGFPGYKFAQIQWQAHSQGALFLPHIVLLLAGTNNVLAGDSLASLQAAFDGLLAATHAAAPGAVVIVSTLPPLKDATTDAAAVTFNTWLLEHVTAPDQVVDMRAAAALTSDDLADTVHLNAAAYDRMGAVWASLVLPLLP